MDQVTTIGLDIAKSVFQVHGIGADVLSMVRLRLRGLTGAREEFLLTATVQNLKRLARHSTIPPPLLIGA